MASTVEVHIHTRLLLQLCLSCLTHLKGVAASGLLQHFDCIISSADYGSQTSEGAV